MKTGTKSRMIKADNLWKKAIRIRDKGICQKCLKKGNNPHHIFTRSIKHMRHYLENGILLCPYCHVFGNESAHKGPEAFRDFLIGYMGFDRYKALKQNSWLALKPDYEMSIIFLKDYLKGTKNE
jgi:hypothetical protein